MKQKICLPLFIILFIGIFVGSVPTATASADITGKWYGTWEMNDTGYSSNSSVTFDGPWAIIYVPELGLFDTYLPVTIEDNSLGYIVNIGIPGIVEMSGALHGDSISGLFNAPTYSGFWQIQKYTGEEVFPGDAPGQQCENLPPAFCMGSTEYCSEIVLFEPRTGMGYLDKDNSGRIFSYLRRDLMQLVKYAAAKVACKTADWDYGNLAPLDLLDMSEWDGSTPGTNYPPLRHPPGTHEGGRDIDTAYYQLYAIDNSARPVCVHYDGHAEAYHCVGEPYGLDKWRTALYIAYLSGHPRLRVVGVDGKVGPVVEEALDELVGSSWIDPDLRDSIPLAYEEENTGMGWYRFHHHHKHTSMNPLHDIVASADLKPDTLYKESSGKYVTAYIELDEDFEASQIDIDSVALIIGGHTMLYTEPGFNEISDYNNNGIADLTVKFDRQKVIGLIDNGNVEVSITGLADGNSFFQDSDTVRVFGKQHKDSSMKHHNPHAIPYARPGNRDIWATE